MPDKARAMIERMKAANAKGNYGFPEGVIAEWIATPSQYTTLVDPTNGKIVARKTQQATATDRAAQWATTAVR